MTAQTPTERKRAERERRAAEGLVRREVWTRPDLWEQIKRYIDTIHENQGEQQ